MFKFSFSVKIKILQPAFVFQTISCLAVNTGLSLNWFEL